ncbi:hypothetical protein KSU15_20395, partial [Escherichia coli]|nr:hypothetical protein [Escherichia coli]
HRALSEHKTLSVSWSHYQDAVLSPAAERFFALLINLWTDDKDNLWTNIVERQRHALQEIG